MGLTEKFAAGSPEGQVPVPASVPSGWQPSVTYRPDGSAEVVTLGYGTPSDEDAVEELAALGVSLPDGFVPRLVQVTHDPAAWVRRGQGLDAETVEVTRRKWVIVPAVASISADELLTAIGKRRPKRAEPVADGWARVVALSDWQIGKVAYGQGTDATVQRILDGLDRLVALLKDRRRYPTSTVVLACLGDMCEGVTSQSGAVALSSDLGLTEQIRVIRRLLLEYVKAVAPLVDRVVVPAVPGNHDEPHRLMGGKPRADDSWCVDVALQVADALHLAGGYEHVEFVTPDVDDLTVTVEAEGTVLGLAHGHQMRAGKAHDWWSKQGHARRRIGQAHILVTGHYHHFRVEDQASRLHIQAATVDPGSPWWDQKMGGGPRAGTVTFVTRDASWADLDIL